MYLRTLNVVSTSYILTEKYGINLVVKLTKIRILGIYKFRTRNLTQYISVIFYAISTEFKPNLLLNFITKSFTKWYA